MRVTLVSIRPSEAAHMAGNPDLTPELLAACGARYSRNNEGLDAILSKIDPNNLDKSVDSIFRMIDYGHQSIADMVPVSMFIDNISIWLAYLIWSWCPTASGQESSTRYIKLSREGIVDPADFGIAEEDVPEWEEFISASFDHYQQALTFWEQVASDNPEASRIPKSLLDDPSEKAQKQVARMKRNFAFDRSRYFLPVAALTNMMLIMSARGWVQLCQYLLSYPLPEAKKLGEAILSQLALDAPRMVKHAERKESTAKGFNQEFNNLVLRAKELLDGPPIGLAEATAHIELMLPPEVDDAALADSLEFHDNRYAWIGEAARMTSIRFTWDAVAIAEIRDLNRHRTGSKRCPLVPVGFYCCDDDARRHGAELPKSFSDFGFKAITKSLTYLANSKCSYVGFGLLGNQFLFSHVTTLDKYVYEAELRTGTGAHFRYANHLRDAMQKLELRLPRLTKKVAVGTAEPE